MPNFFKKSRERRNNERTGPEGRGGTFDFDNEKERQTVYTRHPLGLNPQETPQRQYLPNPYSFSQPHPPGYASSGRQNPNPQDTYPSSGRQETYPSSGQPNTNPSSGRQNPNPQDPYPSSRRQDIYPQNPYPSSGQQNTYGVDRPQDTYSQDIYPSSSRQANIQTPPNPGSQSSVYSSQPERQHRRKGRVYSEYDPNNKF